ncbi:meiotically up-regulated protein [Acrodontium crateriforme]|uniref:Meiotically up-regulated protein n=1 Tax=Acrodontium crateriforme TaxID=150365 RepID=A0AAQ3M9L3_9PEZI|nr:meiotically up-regulated protein [Acrodontium crateriforme]
MSGHDDVEESRRRYKAPYNAKHQIPTIQRYKEEKKARRAAAGEDDESNRTDRWREYWRGGSDGRKELRDEQPSDADDDHGKDDVKEDNLDNYDDEEPMVDTTEHTAVSADPKSKRKGMKKRKNDGAERQVTDPVTHLPVTIHDYTSQALEEAGENDPSFGSTKRTATGLSNKDKSNQELQKEMHEMEQGGEAMNALFPPPHFDAIRGELLSVNQLGVTVGLLGITVILICGVIFERLFAHFIMPNLSSQHTDRTKWLTSLAVLFISGLISIGSIWALIAGVRNWMARKIDDLWEDEVWEARRQTAKRDAKAHEIEPVAWLNSLMAAVWPLINPDLFTSLSDTLEDVMQASLPGLVHMVSVDDIGQGSESLRILGIRWLPTGAAARSVNSEGKLASRTRNKHNDRAVPGEGEVDDSGKDENDDKPKKQKGDDGTEKEIAEGMEAEEGDFVNLEVAFAYRARHESNSMKDRTKHMHLLISFYLPGNIKIPVWVDLRGIVGTMRMRLQLTPDPPFFALCTLTFLGQPKTSISCIPIVKHGLNIMDLPLISNFVQSSVDAAMAEYVAPKSLTLDLKDMLAGDDFKKDTNARGVLVVTIKRGYDFTQGDPGIPLIKEGGADPYVSLAWAKFGKPLWSTRLMLNEMEPCWNETAYLLVTPEELHVDERLRVQLWDSDRFTADDDLGRIEIDLKKLMRDEETNGRMGDRSDSFRALKAGEEMPGKLEWSVGYFSKTRLQACQFQNQTYDENIRTQKQLEDQVDQICRKKLREANVKKIKKDGQSLEEKELEQQKAQEMKMRQDAMIISAPPPDDYPSGIFSIQIHQINGLGLETLSKPRDDPVDSKEDEHEEGDHLPSAYCTVIINHHKVFKTRTKPKNAKPFFNAGVERFLPDWQNAEVFVTVRDARLKEDNPLLGIVHLPLGDLFHSRSQVSGFYPLTGGVGFGRIRLSMVWRSVQLQAPRKALGWEYGTLEVHSGVKHSNDLPSDLTNTKLKFHTDLGSAKMHVKSDNPGWHVRSKNRQSLRLPVRKRYSSCLALEFTQHSLLNSSPAAFAVLWLSELPDEHETEITLPVWKGDFARATKNCIETCGEKIGTVTLHVTFWTGLGGAHSRWAAKNHDLREIIEVLDTARDNDESHHSAKKAGIVDEEATSSNDEDSSDDDDDDDDEDRDEGVDKKRPDGAVSGQGSNGRSADEAQQDAENGELDDFERAKSGKSGKGGKMNIIDSAKDYRKHQQSENRRNRGLMQWRAPRTARWAIHKAERASENVTDLFKHHRREPGLETEV